MCSACIEIATFLVQKYDIIICKTPIPHYVYIIFIRNARVSCLACYCDKRKTCRMG